MTPDEERLCRPYHRALFEKWTAGEYTLEEAVYIAKYCEFNWSLRLHNWPEWLVDLASDLHFYLHEFRTWLKDRSAGDPPAGSRPARPHAEKQTRGERPECR